MHRVTAVIHTLTLVKPDMSGLGRLAKKPLRPANSGSSTRCDSASHSGEPMARNASLTTTASTTTASGLGTGRLRSRSERFHSTISTMHATLMMTAPNSSD